MTNTSKADWEEEFEEKFIYEIFEGSGGSGIETSRYKTGEYLKGTPEQLKSFISQTLERESRKINFEMLKESYENGKDVAIQQVIKMIEGKKRPNAYLEDGTLQERDNWFYNLAVEDIIQELKEIE